MNALAVANIIPSTTSSPAAVGLALDSAEGSAAGLSAEGAFGELLGKQIALLDPKLQDLDALIADDAATLDLPVQSVDLSLQSIDPESLIQQIMPLLKQDVAGTVDGTDDEALNDLGVIPISVTQADSLTQTDLYASAIALPTGNLSPSSVVAAMPTGKDLPSTLDLPTSFKVSDKFATANAHANTNTQTEVSDEFGAALAARIGVEKSAAVFDAAQGQSQITATNNIATQAQVANSAPLSAGIPQQVGSPHWDTGLSDKVVWMLGTQTKMAELHLNPPNLGPLEVRISMADGQANLSFMTQHNAVGEAIESAKSRLREMMGESGVNMGSVSVNVGSFAQQQQQQQTQQQSSSQSPDGKTVTDITWLPEGESAEAMTTSVQPLREQGLVNVFA